MATMTVSLPDAMKDWIEAQIRRGEYASASDYVRDLIRRDRDRREQELTVEDLRLKLADSRSSGVSAVPSTKSSAKPRRSARPAASAWVNIGSRKTPLMIC